MKFEDLKLPTLDLVVEDRERVARAVYHQMRDHYEREEPAEELFEHPDMPGKKFRRLKVGEVRERTDFACSVNPNSTWVSCATYGYAVGENEACHYYREVPQPAKEWRLPAPPPGRQWHRTDWTQDMLPEGYRPLLLGEVEQRQDEVLIDGEWSTGPLSTKNGAQRIDFLRRTRRPLPAPVEYIPLGPEDVQPGSVVRTIGASWWKQVTGVRAENATVCAAGNLSWPELANKWEILRPGSSTWEPCKKPKA